MACGGAFAFAQQRACLLALSFAQIKKNAGERVNGTGAAFAKRACHAANQTCRGLFDISAQPSQPPGRDSQRLLFYYALRAKEGALSLEKSLSCQNHLKFFWADVIPCFEGHFVTMRGVNGMLL